MATDAGRKLDRASLRREVAAPLYEEFILPFSSLDGNHILSVSSLTKYVAHEFKNLP
jgi:hypothetical protein